MNESFVYIWRDRVLNKYYLGYSNGSKPNYICSSKPMMIQYKVRPQDFKRRILATGTVKEMALLEKRLLKLRYKHFGSRYYNLALSFPIYKRTDETRRTMTIAKLNQSEETKRKISIAHIGMKHSKETCRKISVAQEGKKQSEESNRKRSKTMKGRPQNPMSVRKMAETKRGKKRKPFTEEHKLNMRGKIPWNKGKTYTHHELSIKKKLEKEEKQKQKEEKEKQKEKKIKLTPY